MILAFFVGFSSATLMATFVVGRDEQKDRQAGRCRRCGKDLT